MILVVVISNSVFWCVCRCVCVCVCVGVVLDDDWHGGGGCILRCLVY